VLRARKDAEGDFLRAALGPDFFPTSSGYMACVSAGGKSLGSNPQKALEAFNKLPEAERKPGAVQVGPLGQVDAAAAAPAPPKGGLVLKSYGRFLARDDKGELRRVTLKDFPLMAEYKPERLGQVGYLFESHPDFLWLTEAEWKSLIPAGAKVKDKVAVPENLVRRLCRYHLIPERIYGEGGGWSVKSIRAAELTLVVEDVSATGLRLRAEGFARLGSAYDADMATSPDGPLPLGYEPRLQGVIEYDASKSAIARFDLVALGDCWGRMGDANGKSVAVERSGRHPLGFAFELADPSVPANRLIPAGRASRVRPGGEYWK
jgi:hypothetical protein